MTMLRDRRSENAAAPRPTRKFRPELQGMRALAASLVVIYHVWLGRVSGGVDVFFVISGFLITGQLFRACLRGGIEYRPMWGRMIKRLFPAALTVLTVTMLGAVLLQSEHRWLQTIREVVASALYMENWRLAADSADYFAQHDQASLLQHFWSLSVQGQFYVVWPLLVALVALVARRAGWSLRRSLFAALGVVLAASLAYSVYLTAVNQPLAYFMSLTHVWEFALGGVIALIIDAIMLPKTLRIALGWIGVAGLVSCGLVLQVGRMFPGYVALWPTTAAVLVLLAGATESKVGVDRLLSSRPLNYLGNLGFTLYLWHWPVLLFYLMARERSEVGWRGGALIIAVSLVLSVLTYHFVEQPVRNSRIGVATRWGAYRFGVAALAPVLVAAGIWQFVTVQRASFTHDLADPDHPGAQVLSAGAPIVDVDQSVIPPVAALPNEFANYPSEACDRKPDFYDLQMCTVGSTDPAARRIVVVGDSHAQQLAAALRPSLKTRNWQLTSMLRGGCPLTADSADPGCAAWNDAVIAELTEMKPDAVVTLATRDVRVGLRDQTPAGYVEQWRRLADAAIPVVGVRDNPRFDFNPPDCVQKHGIDARECGRPRTDMLATEAPYEAIENLPGNVSFLDLSDYYCTADFCPPVVGNVYVYLDGNHVTKTYMETMAPLVEQQLMDALGWEQPAPPPTTQPG
jgi:peptidoglycan/LPS O-acetylase OafA/YrhL